MEMAKVFVIQRELHHGSNYASMIVVKMFTIYDKDSLDILSYKKLTNFERGYAVKVIELQKISQNNKQIVNFIRIEPENLHDTLLHIIHTLSDLSWISDFDEEYIRDSFRQRANDTLLDIQEKLNNASTDQVSSDAGEYVVSELAREAIVDQLGYSNIPLAELYNKKKSGNPGFDFHSENDCETIIFGEAKYLCNKNAYGSGLKQVVRFIENKKDIKDLVDLRDFFSNQSLAKAHKGEKGFAIAFSSKNTPSETLINNIKENKDYQKLLCYSEIILAAVNI